jgi:hypothetical protein
MNEPSNSETSLRIDQEPEPKETPQTVLHKSGGQAEITLRSAVTWCEAISPWEQGCWVGY